MNPKFSVGTKISTTRAVLDLAGNIVRRPAVGVVTGVHDYYRGRLPTPGWVYHVDVEGLDQLFTEHEIEVLVSQGAKP